MSVPTEMSWRSTERLAHDLGVGLDVGGARGVLGDGAQVGQPAGVLQLARLLQGLRQGDHVEGLLVLRQLAHGGEDQPVLRR